MSDQQKICATLLVLMFMLCVFLLSEVRVSIELQQPMFKHEVAPSCGDDLTE